MCNGLRLRQIRCFVCQLSHAWQHRLSFGSTTIKINCCSSLKKTFTPVYHQLQKNHSFSTKKCPYTDSDRPQRMVLYPQDRFQSLLLLQIDLRQRCTCNSSTTIVRMSRTWFILLLSSILNHFTWFYTYYMTAAKTYLGTKMSERYINTIDFEFWRQK